MNADRIDFYANLMRGVAEKDIGRKIREILFDATNEAEKAVNADRVAELEAKLKYAEGMAELRINQEKLLEIAIESLEAKLKIATSTLEELQRCAIPMGELATLTERALKAMKG